MLGLTGETLTLNRSHTPTQRPRVYFTLRSTGARGRPLYRLSVHIGCTGVSPSINIYINVATHLLRSAGRPAMHLLHSAGQPAALRVSPWLFNISFCSAGQPAVHLFRTLRVGPLLIFYTLRVSPLKSFSFCGSARPTSFVFCGSARHCVVGDHVKCTTFFSKI